MKTKIIHKLSAVFAALLVLGGCSEPEHSFGDLAAPSNVVVNAEIVGQNEDNPYGDGSGEVIVSVDADNAMTYQIDFGTSSSLNLVPFDGEITRRYTTTGVNDYTITVVVYGKGGMATNVVEEITVRSDFDPAPEIVENLTGNSSKTWVVDNSIAGHFGVGPWSDGSASPEWYSAGVNEKADCCNCFYTASFTFIKEGENSFSLDVDTPDGAFTKTGDLTSLPGIPASGEEGCYDYSGGTSEFSFVPASTSLPPSAGSTSTSISLAGNETFIGYGAVLKEYEILEITPESLYLRVQGTETGNAWYLKLVPASAESE